MANRTLNLVETINHGVVTLYGSFLPQGSSNPLPNPIWFNSASTLGQWGQGIANIVFASTGVWTGTLSDAWYRVIGMGGDVRMADGAAAANANNLQLQNINVTGQTVNSIAPKTFSITNTNTGALANIAAGTNQICYFQITVQKTSVQ